MHGKNFQKVFKFCFFGRTQVLLVIVHPVRNWVEYSKKRPKRERLNLDARVISPKPKELSLGKFALTHFPYPYHKLAEKLSRFFPRYKICGCLNLNQREIISPLPMTIAPFPGCVSQTRSKQERFKEEFFLGFQKNSAQIRESPDLSHFSKGLKRGFSQRPLSSSKIS